MEGIEFLEYLPTPNERHTGIASIRIDKRFIFRFKIIENKSGGYFPASASFKMPKKDEKDVYVSAVELLYEKKDINQFVMDNVNKEMNPKEQATKEQSVFGKATKTYEQQNIPF